MLSVSTFKLQGVSQKFSSMNCRFIELKAFLKSIVKITFSLSWGLSIKQRKTCKANSAPTFWCLHLLLDFHILHDVIRRHGIRHILLTTGGKYCLQRVGGSRSKERDRKSELVLRSTYQIFEWDRNNSDRSFYNVVRYVQIPLVP